MAEPVQGNLDRPITIAEDMECPLDGLPAEELRGICERLREELRRRTVALASAVHELRTPLAIMDGYIDLLWAGKAGDLSEKQRPIVDDMRANAKRLKSFISDFLTFTAIETRSMTMHLQSADLNGCVSETCGLWLPRFQRKGTTLYFSPEDELPPFPFDHLKVQHVVSNLLHNALKFTPEKGTVWVTVEKVAWERRLRTEPISVEKRRREIIKLPKAARVAVADTGPGVDPEFHLEIFQDFRKLATQDQSEQSMGLGLSIARRLVQAHGGKIWVESKPGEGAKFLFLLPIPKPETEA
ncbi:MAG: HAMP domain-containing histidine kinase [Acidobacteriales bacterium]|nr:HAMP domain-containing histidine kinase [Terriglobales bacterium]